MTDKNQAAQTRLVRQEAMAARRRLYAAIKEIDGILVQKPEDMAARIKPYIRAAGELPGNAMGIAAG